MRPALTPGLLAVWRNRDTVQIGIDPRRAVALTGMREAAAVLSLLDGSRDRAQVLAAARDLGVEEASADRVISLLAAGGVLQDFPAGTYQGLSTATRSRLAPELATAALAHGECDGGARALARRQAAYVRVHGASQVGLRTAALLASAGVGRVISTGLAPPVLPADRQPGTPSDATCRPGPGPGTPHDAPTGSWEWQALAGQPGNGRLETPEASRRSMAGTPHDRAPAEPAAAELPTGLPWRVGANGQRVRRSRGARRPARRPDLVVIADTHNRALPAALVRDQVPHLAASASEAIGVVGPLVVPGRAACLRCLDMTRAERDPAWPVILAQLSQRGADPLACDTLLASAVATQVASQALAFLERGMAASAVTDGTLELVLPGWQWCRRSWRAHPRCDCGTCWTK